MRVVRYVKYPMVQEQSATTASAEPGYTFSTSGRYALLRLFIESMAGVDDEMKGLGFVSIDERQAERLAEGHRIFPEAGSNGVVASAISPPDFLAIATVCRNH